MNDKGMFASEIVRKEVERMHELYKEIYMSAPLVMMKSKEEQQELFDKMEKLIEMQEILYTRVNLSDDEDSELVKENFRVAAKQLGLPTSQVGPEIFKVARSSINAMRQHMLDTEQ